MEGVAIMGRGTMLEGHPPSRPTKSATEINDEKFK